MQVDAIFCADIHLRETAPVCYKNPEDFYEEQWNALQTIKELQVKYKCPVYCAGDLFDYWKPSPWLLSKTIEYLPEQFFTVIGNHDVAQHNLDLIDKCGVNVLAQAGKLTILNETHFGNTPNSLLNLKNKKLIVWHVMVWDGIHTPFQTFDTSTSSAKKLLKKYEADVMVTGDNHIPFVVNRKKSILVNPGSLTRQKADQINHRPRVYLWNENTNAVKPFYMPISKDAITREHIEEEEKRNERLSVFISRLNGGGMDSLSFEDNLQLFFKKNKVSKKIVSLINKTL